ncbi:MAG: hypothetical protein LBS59_05085 [Puniceicoccales bacterium]|jgi:hypothetical protein|nr:hypothetical protein [Puniceicoccales bacterium]
MSSSEILTDEEFNRVDKDTKLLVSLSLAKRSAYYARKFPPPKPEKKSFLHRWFAYEMTKEERERWEREERRRAKAPSNRGGSDFPWISAAIAGFSIFGDW